MAAPDRELIRKAQGVQTHAIQADKTDQFVSMIHGRRRRRDGVQPITLYRTVPV